ncbi:chitinase, partial [Kitasatospora sp. LaBMicrA B282]|uniref:chitinase n=1 Tax=Kitasatospora sp. LaBMicrA B282 TaxID=3420949 RepID=UPI003D138353
APPAPPLAAAAAGAVAAVPTTLPATDRGVPLRPSGSGFGARFAAPYVEVWNSPAVLRQVQRATGIKNFTLAFVIPDGGCAGAFDGTIPIDNRDWLWAVNDLRRAGGDVMISFGGGNSRELAETCGSVAELKAAYRKVIDTYDLTRIDLDIEGDVLEDQPANDLRNQALAELQHDYAAAGRRLAVQYTLPVNPWGLSSGATALLENARQHQLDVDLVNIMTMDYGPSYDMGATAIQAATALHAQLGRIWPEKTDADRWAMQGLTPMIGVNDGGIEVFTADDATRLAAFAADKGIRLLAFWSLGRDRPCQADDSFSDRCSGIHQNPEDFARILSGASADLLHHWMDQGGNPAS